MRRIELDKDYIIEFHINDGRKILTIYKKDDDQYRLFIGKDTYRIDSLRIEQMIDELIGDKSD